MGAKLHAAMPAPWNELYLWWLGYPESPVRIGVLRFVPSMRGVSLQYDAHWLAQGFALSEDLPLLDQVFLPLHKDTAAGAVDDARPDRWGERVIRLLDRPVRLSLMEYLFLAGDERFGALGVSLSGEAYQGRELGPLPRLPDVGVLHDLVKQVTAGEPVRDELKRLIAPGVTMGGARPKALIELDGQPWVIKFAETGEMQDWPLIEHAAMTLAARAGITVAPTRALALPRGHAVAVQRFDRRIDQQGRPQRVHALSAHVALQAAGEEMGYPELAQLLRRRGVVRDGVSQAQMRELFRRMVFNVLAANCDDHTKNLSFIRRREGPWRLAPAYDVTHAHNPKGRWTYQHLMSVNGRFRDIGRADLEAVGDRFLVPRYRQVIREVVAAVQRWPEFAAQAHLPQDILQEVQGDFPAVA